MPPATGNDDAFGHDLAIADQVLADDVDIVELPCWTEMRVASPALPGLRLPSSGRRSAIAALTVEAATTSASGMPMHRNLDNVVT